MKLGPFKFIYFIAPKIVMDSNYISAD